MTLNLTSLEKATAALEKSIIAADSEVTASNKDIADTIRSGVIQNFEVAYEQCWKFIRRWIRENRTPEDADHPRTRKELFRLAARYKLISDPSPWFEFGDARNLTSHTYEEEHAETVFTAARRFLPYAVELLENLRAMND